MTEYEFSQAMMEEHAARFRSGVITSDDYRAFLVRSGMTAQEAQQEIVYQMKEKEIRAEYNKGSMAVALFFHKDTKKPYKRMCKVITVFDNGCTVQLADGSYATKRFESMRPAGPEEVAMWERDRSQVDAAMAKTDFNALAEFKQEFGL